MAIDDLKDKYAGLTPAQKAAVIAGTAIVAGGTVIPVLGFGVTKAASAISTAVGSGKTFLSAQSQALTDAIGTKGRDFLGKAAQAAAVYAPNRFEQQFRRQTLANARRLEGARSGLTKGQEDAAIAKANMVIQATQQERQAQLARSMGGMQTGASGVGAEAQRQLTKDTMAQQRAGTSAVQSEGIKKLERDQKQAMADTLRASAMEQQRRKFASDVFKAEESSDEELAQKALSNIKPGSTEAKDLLKTLGA